MYPIPANATRIRYLESTGTQYIDTGIYSDATTVFSVDAQFTSWNTTSPECFGSYNNRFAFGKINSTNTAYNFIVQTSTAISPSISLDTNRHVFVIDAQSGVAKIDNTSKSFLRSITQSSNPLWLFNRSGASAPCSARVFGCKIEQNGSLVRSFVPVRVGSIGGLFDRVTGQFFYNKGTGSFVCGEDDFSIFSHAVKHVEVETSSRPYDAEVEYLESNGTQYVDTGIYYERPIEFQADVSVTKIEGFNCVFGCSTVTNRFYIGISKAGNVDLGMGGGVASPSLAQSIVLGQRYLFHYRLASRRTIWQDGTSLWTGDLQPAPSNVSIWAFGSRRGPSDSEAYQRSSDGWKGRIYAFKIMQGSGYPPVRDFIPVRVGTEYCLYDKANPTGGDNGDGLYHNKGTGAFLGGSDTGPSIVLASRVIGDSSGTVKAVRKHYDMPVQYTIDECNGDAPTAVNVYFPSGTYEDLDYTPTWFGHRFVGWYTTSATPSTTTPTSGTQVQKGDPVVFDRSTVYARWQLPTTVTFDATTNGGQMPSGWTALDYYEGQPYGTLPVPTKSGEVFLGWFTSGGTRITESSTVTAGTLTARYMEVTYDTSFEVTTASSYRKAGIYSTTALNSSNPTVVDWGDGTTDVVYGNISQLVHTYSSNGTFTMRVNDSISSIALSTNNATWYNTTTNNSTTIRKILSLSANITSLPSYAFYYCQQMRDVSLSTGSSNLTLGTYAFAYCFYQSAAVGTVDLSARKITSIPNYCFYYCRYLKGITWPQGLTSIGGSAFRFCFYYASSAGTVEIPEGVTSISGTTAFGSCSYLTAVTLPSTLTNLNNYTFTGCTRLATITSNRSTAPTVSSASFGTNTSSYTGRTAYSAGTNKLYVPAGATGYNASYWSSVLLDSTKCGFTLEEMASGKTLPVTIVGSGYGGNTSYSMTIDDVGGTLTITNMYGNYSFADASNWRIMDFRATSTTESFVIMETATNSNIVVVLKTYGCSEDFVGYSGAIIDSADFEP